MGKPENAVILGLSSSAIMNGDIGLSEPSTGTSGLPTENCTEMPSVQYSGLLFFPSLGSSSGTYYSIGIIDTECLINMCLSVYVEAKRAVLCEFP